VKREWRRHLSPSDRILLADYDRLLAEIDYELAELRIKVQRLVHGGSAALKSIRETWAPVIEGRARIARLQCERTTVAAHRHKLINNASVKAGKAKAA